MDITSVITPENFMMMWWWEHGEKVGTDGRTDWLNHSNRAAWSQLKIHLKMSAEGKLFSSGLNISPKLVHYLITQTSQRILLLLNLSVTVRSFRLMHFIFFYKQGKSEGFDRCDRPSNVTWNWIQIIDFLALVTLKFDGWPLKKIGHLFYTT